MMLVPIGNVWGINCKYLTIVPVSMHSPLYQCTHPCIDALVAPSSHPPRVQIQSMGSTPGSAGSPSGSGGRLRQQLSGLHLTAAMGGRGGPALAHKRAYEGDPGLFAQRPKVRCLILSGCSGTGGGGGT